ncbi:MAG: hypothetical protein QOK30_2621 [Nocardioidaceae bacterium]|nr:hypothetical protein [Nocardioidaceae bacterium]
MAHHTAAVTTVAALALIAAGTACPATGATAGSATPQAVAVHSSGGRTHPTPSHFTRGRVDNPWFPLRPGNRLVSIGTEGRNHLRDAFLTTYSTAVIDGVTCRAVRDRLFQNGILREVTTDWYAQTRRGTVWYFGERTAELDRAGHVVSREGSFRSGRNGAEAGVFMPAHPRVGQSFRQEDYPGHAEDHFAIRDLSAHISVPVVASHHAMLTRETSPLEPGVVDHKYYVRDIGTVREVTVKGGTESLKLVSIRHIRR